MSNLDDAKKKYNEIPIPEELSERVQEAVARSTEKRDRMKKIVSLNERRKFRNREASFRNSGAKVAAAAVVVCTMGFMTALNTSVAFAETACQLPVIGAVAQLLTFRSYEKTENDIHVNVDMPSVEMIAEDTSLADFINQEIHDLCSRYADEALERAKAYKEAFLSTGGTEEEWVAHKIQITVEYEIKSQTEEYLSFVVTGTENWNSGGNENRYYSLDLKSEKLVALKDVLGDNYQQIADDSIRVQMEERAVTDGIPFFTEAEGGFTGINENTRFYMNEAGNPVIVFDKYEVAPGAYGMLEFEIAK